MLRPFAVAVCAAVLSLSAHALTEVVGEAASDEARVIVKFKATSPVARVQGLNPQAEAAARASDLGARTGVPMRAGSAISDRSQVVFGRGLSAAALSQRLSSQPDVEYAVPDQRRQRMTAPNDPLYFSALGLGPASGQWYLRSNTGEVKSSIDVETAWSVTLGSPAMIVAVLDTGVRYDHPDLGANLLPGYDMVSDAVAANDGDGRDADPTDPGDWVTAAEINAPGSAFAGCAPEPSSWHGTQTASLVAALTDNGLGLASVGRSVRVLPVRVLGKCGGFDSDIIAALRWSVGLAVPGAPLNPNPARVINMSLGGPGTCEQSYIDVTSEVTATGAVIVASSGNAAGHAIGAPGNCPFVMAVGGLRHVGTKVGFSNLGQNVAISAPGGNCVNTAPGTPCLYPIVSATNSGTTGPVASTYSDSFNASVGTSFSAPLVAGTAALVLSARPELSPPQVQYILQATARPFPTSGGTPGIGVCTQPQYTPAGVPIDQLECYCTTSTCGSGMLDAGAALQATAAWPPLQDFNVQGLWWNAPAGSEGGWGINFAHQGDVVFVTWFTYDATGKAWWLSMTANKVGPNTYAGSLMETHGPAFNESPFNPALVTSRAVGNATLNFSAHDTGTFSYTVNGVSQAKTITREVYGTVPVCTFALHPPLASAANYQDLWWASPAGSESGWGMNITMQSDVIFVTWFTYDQDQGPLWLSGTAYASGTNTFVGTLNRTTGPPFNAVPFDPANVRLTPVGPFTLTFSDGNNAQFVYIVNNIAGAKNITRQVFRTPGTVCS